MKLEQKREEEEKRKMSDIKLILLLKNNNWQERKERTEITKNILTCYNEESEMKLEQKREEEDKRKM